MAYKFREEIVGKRFISVSGFGKLKVNKISEWGWRAGVIRAASHRDNLCQDLQVSTPTFFLLFFPFFVSRLESMSTCIFGWSRFCVRYRYVHREMRERERESRGW